MTHNEMLDDLRLYADACKALAIGWCEKHTGARWKNNGARPEAEEAAEPAKEQAEEPRADAVRQ